MGMEKRLPSARRLSLQTLKLVSAYFLCCVHACPCNQPIVVLLVHETLQRGEATVDDELEIAELALVQDDSGESLGLGGEFVAARSIASNKILQDTTWGLNVSGLAIWSSGCRRRRFIPWGGLAILGNFCYV
jgi:hypothetical protein